MRISITFILIFICSFSNAQSLNDYQYVVVDNQYEFQNQANEYRLNEMMVFEIKKRGLLAYRNTEMLPKDLNVGTCNALSLRVIEKSGLRVKMTFEFVDCDGEVVYRTQEGIGRTKNFEKAYREAIRDAMKSLDELEYKYKKPKNDVPTGKEIPIQVLEPSAVPTQLDVKSTDEVKKEVEDVPFSQEQGQTRNRSFISSSKEYNLQATASGFNVFKNNNLIGTLKKSQSGCYLAITTEFMGIGYEKDGDFIIEYDKNGTQFLRFKKQ